MVLTDIAAIQHNFLLSANKHELQVSNVQLTVLLALFSNERHFMSCSDIAAACEFSKAQLRQSGDGVFASLEKKGLIDINRKSKAVCFLSVAGRDFVGKLLLETKQKLNILCGSALR